MKYPNATHINQTTQYPNFQTPASTRQNHPLYHQVPPPPGNNHSLPRPKVEKKAPRVFSPLVENRTFVLIHTIDPKYLNVSFIHYMADLHCAYHSRGVGHAIEDCINLMHKIQDLIDQNVVTLQTVIPNANTDSLPNHEKFTINMIKVKKIGV